MHYDIFHIFYKMEILCNKITEKEIIQVYTDIKDKGKENML